MNGPLKQRWLPLVWIGLLVVAALLMWQGASLRTRQQELVASIVTARRENVELSRKHKRDANVRTVIMGLRNGREGMDLKLAGMLKQCKSRNDFLIREGDRIAWSSLRSSTESRRALGFYLPAGTHRLKYAVIEPVRGLGILREQAWNRNVSFGDGVISCDLGPEPEVFELWLSAAAEMPLRLELIGKNDALTHARELTPVSKYSKIQMEVTSHAFAYPSEWRSRDRPQPNFHTQTLLPATNLALIEVHDLMTNKQTGVLVWIESDASPCMTAIDLVAQFPSIGALSLPKSQLTPRRWNNDELSNLFEPYDGSGVFRFRPGLVEQVPAQRGNYGFSLKGS